MGRRRHRRCLKRIAELERELEILDAEINPFYVVSERMSFVWSTCSDVKPIAVDVPRFVATPLTHLIPNQSPFTMPQMEERR